MAKSVPGECEGLIPRQCRGRCPARSQEVREQPSRYPDTWTQSCHPPMWMAVSSSCRRVWPWFSDATADVRATFPWHHWVSSHIPLFPAGRLEILLSRQHFLGSADNAPSAWLGFPVPFMLFANLSRRDQKEDFASPLLTSPAAQTEGWVNPEFSGEKIWLAPLGPVSSLFWKGDDIV